MITVFSKQWFKKYNKVITWLARLPFVGELIFNFKKFGHYIDRKKIVEITPNSVIEFVKRKGKKVELKQHFFVRNEYALRLQKIFYPIWITFHIWDIITRPIPQLNLGFDTLTAYPDVGSGETTCDGYVNRAAVNETWATIRDNANGNIAKTNNTRSNAVRIKSSTTENQWDTICKGFFSFDTSSLTSEATISASVLSLYGYAMQDDLSINPNIDIYVSTQAAVNNLENADYSAVGTTSQTGSPIDYEDFSLDAYNDFTFNATGRGNISKTGVSKFATRNANYDVADSAPSSWTANKDNYIYVNYSDYDSNKPKLVVTYTTVVGPANVKTYKGLAAASVKTCKGLAIASVKSKKGLA